MKDKQTYTHLKEHGEDRGPLDLTRQVEELTETIKAFEFLVNTLKQEIFEAKKIASENEKNKNLLQGYRKVIEELSNKLRQKD